MKKRLLAITVCFMGIALLCGCGNSTSTASQDGDNGTTTTETTVDVTEENNADTDVQYETMYVVNCQESITLRSADNTSASEITQIPFGAAVSYVSTADNGFYEVIYNGHTGYALASYLDYTRQDTPAAASTTENSIPSNTTLYVVNCKESISLRSSNSSSSTAIMQIPLGAAVTYISNAGNGFYEINYNGHTGYALSAYLGYDKQNTSTAESGGSQNSQSNSTAGSGALANVIFNSSYDSNGESAVVKAVDENGATLWTYNTGTYMATELSQTTEIGVNGNCYYLVEGGTVVCLNKQSGDVVWKTSGDYSVGGSNYFCFDGEGNLYVTGYYGPDLTKIDIANGSIVYQVDEYSSDLIWPCSISVNSGTITLNYEADMNNNMEGSTIYIDAATGKIQ